MGTETRVWKEKEKFVVVCLHCTSSINHEIRHFHVEVVQGRQRNVQVRCDARAELLFYCFLPVSLLSPSSMLELPFSSRLAWKFRGGGKAQKHVGSAGVASNPLLELLMQRFHAGLLIITTKKIVDLSLTLSNFYRRSVSRNLMFHGKIRTSKSIDYRFFLDEDAL